MPAAVALTAADLASFGTPQPGLAPLLDAGVLQEALLVNVDAPDLAAGSPFSREELLAQIADGAVLFNAPRPVCARITWAGPGRHGVLYGLVDALILSAGRTPAENVAVFNPLVRDHCWPIALITNAEVEARLRAHHAEQGYALDDYAETGLTMADLAHMIGLPYLETAEAH